jgi:hypothetical protein
MGINSNVQWDTVVVGGVGIAPPPHKYGLIVNCYFTKPVASQDCLASITAHFGITAHPLIIAKLYGDRKTSPEENLPSLHGAE